MNVSGVLGVVIGLVFVFLVLSLVCSGITEAISATVGLRAKTLERGIGRMLGDAGYCSEANLTCPGPDRLIATGKGRNLEHAAHHGGPAGPAAPAGRAACP